MGAKPVEHERDDPLLQADFTDLLRKASDGDQEAREKLAPAIYQVLHTVASRHRRALGPGETFQTGDLVSEAFLKLFGGEEGKGWASRNHFMAVSATAMRSLLVDHARRKNRLKRRPGGERVPLDAIVDQYDRRCGGLEDLDRALTRLTGIDPVSARIVELKFFTGLKTPEIAEAVELPLRTVERKLQMGRAWLREAVAHGS